MEPLLNQSVLILGLGASGLAMARWCVRQGAQVTVADTRQTPPELATLRQQLPGVGFVCAALDAALLERAAPTLLLKSPGLSPEQIKDIAAAARASTTPVRAELDLFAQALADLRTAHAYQPKLLAVTGTNGKTTVTALTAQLVQRAGKTAIAAGNIGPTLLDSLARSLDGDTLPEVWVIELSSFQLADCAKSDGAPGAFEPIAGCLLNISQDHLDWHLTMADYALAKAKVFGQQGLMLLNRDDATVMAMLPAPVRGRTARRHLSFGAQMPQSAGDFGIEQVNGMAWLVRALELDPTHKLRKGQEAEALHIQRLMPADALRIRGRHNAVNALAALALAEAAGCALAPVLFGLREYRGEPHRVAPVAVIREVEYFDDSKGTNVGATVAALTGLGTERKLVLIVGGEGKGQDFSPLAIPVAQFARAVVLIGRDAPTIGAALQSSGVEMVDAASMHDAVAKAHDLARPGDAVVLSPACASFDMFDSYVHRAQVFCEAVAVLADTQQSLSGVSA